MNLLKDCYLEFVNDRDNKSCYLLDPLSQAVCFVVCYINMPTCEPWRFCKWVIPKISGKFQQSLNLHIGDNGSDLCKEVNDNGQSLLLFNWFRYFNVFIHLLNLRLPFEGLKITLDFISELCSLALVLNCSSLLIDMICPSCDKLPYSFLGKFFSGQLCCISKRLENGFMKRPKTGG